LYTYISFVQKILVQN